jgi:hypothetical protein
MQLIELCLAMWSHFWCCHEKVSWVKNAREDMVGKAVVDGEEDRVWTGWITDPCQIVCDVDDHDDYADYIEVSPVSKSQKTPAVCDLKTLAVCGCLEAPGNH